MADDVRVLALQLEYVAGETAAHRISRVLDAVEAAAECDLLVLPELWDVGYFAFDKYSTAARSLLEGPLGPLGEEARARGCVIVAGSVLERHADKLHNTVVALGPDGEILRTYKKIHLFSYGSAEAELLSPGREVVVVETPAGRLGLATCFDLRFPAQFLTMRRMGADIFVVPAAWPAARTEHWRVLIRARAIEHQTPIVACNGVGNCEGVDLAGESLISNAKGDPLAEGLLDAVWLSATIDHASTRRWREEFPLSSIAFEAESGRVTLGLPFA